MIDVQFVRDTQVKGVFAKSFGPGMSLGQFEAAFNLKPCEKVVELFIGNARHIAVRIADETREAQEEAGRKLFAKASEGTESAIILEESECIGNSMGSSDFLLGGNR